MHTVNVLNNQSYPIMENKNTITLKDAVKKYLSVDATLSGPLTASNDKAYYKAQFQVNTVDDDGYIGQSKAYTKLFFEDSHSLLFKKCEEAIANDTPLKILAGRIIVPTDREFYILDENGDRMKKLDGTFRKASSITLFLIADENPITAFNQAVNQITRNNAWVTESVADDEDDDEETKKAKALSKK